MELKNLFSDSSRRTANIAVSVIGNDPEVFKKVLDFAFEDQEAYAMRAARVINLSANIHPELIRPHLNELVLKLPFFRTGGLKRSIVKTISERSFDFDDNTLGILVNTCFDWVNDPMEEIAIKVYSLEVLYRISQFHPDLKQELIASIEHMMPEASAGIKSRGKKYLKKLYKETEVRS